MPDLQQARADLEAAGYVVLRRKSHERTLRDLDRARNALAYAERRVKETREWAHEAFREQHRFTDRLTAVCAASASLGVPIDVINEALGTTGPTPTRGTTT